MGSFSSSNLKYKQSFSMDTFTGRLLESAIGRRLQALRLRRDRLSERHLFHHHRRLLLSAGCWRPTVRPLPSRLLRLLCQRMPRYTIHHNPNHDNCYHKTFLSITIFQRVRALQQARTHLRPGYGTLRLSDRNGRAQVRNLLSWNMELQPC